MIFGDYIQKLQEVLERIRREQAPAICRAGEIVSHAIERDGIVHVFGTGHSHMIVEEAFFRAGGIIAINPMLDERLSFLKGALESTRAEREPGYARTLIAREKIGPEDVAILVSNSGRNCVPVEMAMEMKSRHLSVIAITNLSQSSRSPSLHASGKRLFELADVVVDTCGVEGDAMLTIPGLAYPMGPSSTVAGAAIINSIMIEAAAASLRNGSPLRVLPSANFVTAADETMSELFHAYSQRVRYLDA